MKKTLITILVTVLVCGSVFGTTLALLMDKTAPITNTFTVGDISITLTESKTADADGLRTFKMVPGREIDKDPKITVEGGSEACYLFVKIEESANFDTYMTYGIAKDNSSTVNWEQLKVNDTVVEGVYYREVPASDADQVFEVLSSNQVVVLNTVTKELLEAANTDKPTLTFTAYAVQSEGVADAATAWGYIPNP